MLLPAEQQREVRLSHLASVRLAFLHAIAGSRPSVACNARPPATRLTTVLEPPHDHA